jgi:hypothetical protein
MIQNVYQNIPGKEQVSEMQQTARFSKHNQAALLAACSTEEEECGMEEKGGV